MSGETSPRSAAFGTQLNRRAGLRAGAGPASSGLMMIVECHQPILLEIVSLLSDTPQSFVNFCGLTSRLVSVEIGFAAASIWRGLYSRRWPAFEDCLQHQGVQDWRGLYKATLAGRCECTLEVFDREKKVGFAMAAMAARVQYERSANAYVARYLSASEVLPEMIPHAEGRRLRFCPASARARLSPGTADDNDAREPGTPSAKERLPPYPYRVLEGTDGLAVGQGIELQWKMQLGSPFGWWYGTLEALERDPGGRRATATLIFKHFPPTSRWYRLSVRFGDSELQPCAFGGYTGGIRGVTAAEQRNWLQYFPKEPVLF